MTAKSERLRNLVLDLITQLEHSGGGGFIPSLPAFELYAQDYLEFAEKELLAYQSESTERAKVAHLINCVSHLKRALDCQLDTFLHVYNLYQVFKKRNLKLEKKLDFLGAAGIFSSRSLARLNAIRNKMEHTFEVPKISDIEVFYDLVSAFVAVLQGTIIFSLTSEIEMSINDLEGEKRMGWLKIKYNPQEPEIEAFWVLNDSEEQLKCSINEPEDFTFFFKALFLLYQLESFASSRYVASQLRV